MAGKRNIALGIILAVSAVFLGVSLFSYDSRDWGSFWEARNLCGPIGAVSGGALIFFLGPVFSWAVPVFLLYWSLFRLREKQIRGRARLLTCLVFLAWITAALASIALGRGAGGWLGEKTARFAYLVAGKIGSILILAAALLIDLVLVFLGPIRSLISKMTGISFPFPSFPARGRGRRERRPKKERSEREKGKSPKGKEATDLQPLKERPAEEPVRIEIAEPKRVRSKSQPRAPRSAVSGSTPADDAPLPDISLLDEHDEESVHFSKEDLIARSEVIESKLEDYGLRGKIQHVRPGPVVTTFEFVPAPGVKVSQIANRADDIALALAARAIRIQAPIPGKGAVGIEVPNSEPKLVMLREMIEHYPSGNEGLLVVFGKTVTGEPYYADIAEMPHLLIAGATGSGKSVCINAIICSLLYNHTPATCRFILVDPKRLELITYNNIPHLLHPVITDAKPTLKVLNWLTIEMDRRYKLLAKFGVKNIKSFNERVQSEKLVDPDTEEKLSRLPYYVTIIDELADIMVSMGNEIYPPITRLSQMARAVGIHLVFATQRPSVDVVTGLIKANFPSRIAFQVTSKTDSRTILDVNGAETLLGNGDMLYLPKNLPSPIRIQGAFISEREAENVANYWRSFTWGGEELDLSGEDSPVSGEDAEIDDELFEQARELVIMHQQGSISLVQRRLRVGYARAARLIDMLEQSGVVGPFEGSKAREVLVSREEYEGR